MDCCRVCLIEGVDLTDLVGEQLEMFFTCSGIEPDHNAQIARKICDRCGKNLLLAFEFRRQCQKSDVVLRQRLVRDEESLGEAQDDIRSISESPSPLPRLKPKETPASSFRWKGRRKVVYDEYECDACAARFPTKEKFKCHFLYHHLRDPKERFVCTRCGRSYSQKGQLQSHIKHKHAAEPSNHIYVCPHCGRTFGWKKAMLRHMAGVHENRRHQCKICGVWLKSLAQHMKLHTGTKAFHCTAPGCDRSFAVKIQLQCHQAVHSDQRPFACEHCSKRFKLKVALQKHMRYHTLTYSKACPTCGAVFKTDASLREHSEVHAEVKRFECEACRRRFTYKRTLKEHLRYHTGQLFFCETCAKGFSKRNALRKHAAKHADPATRPRNFGCTYCPKRFLYAGQRNSHERETHIKRGETPASAVVVAAEESRR